MDCGPACLKMIAARYDKHFSLQYLRNLCEISFQGVSAAGIEMAATQLGFKTLTARMPFEILIKKAPLPCIAHWDKRHFVVVWKSDNRHIYVGDPALKRNVKYTHEAFQKNWLTNEASGGVILLEPTADLFKTPDNEVPPISLLSLLSHLRNRRKSLIKIMLTLITASLFSLAIPLLTQSVVDKGIHGKNTGLLVMICLGQLSLFAGRILTEFFRTRVLFRLGMNISLDILSSFLQKLMRISPSFFDRRHDGDNLQRIHDNQRIEEFLTKHTVASLFSAVSVLIYGVMLCYYDSRIFILFLIASCIGITWNYSFEEKRRKLDLRTFRLLAANQQMQVELFAAMQEIRLTGSEKEKERAWRTLQEEMYTVKLEQLRLDQYIQGVSLFINESRNILITLFTALLVIHSSLTMGGMLAIAYICGVLSVPMNQLADYVRVCQDTLFSLRRIAEVWHESDEDNPQQELLKAPGDIIVENLHFRYNNNSPEVLKDISLTIPAGKVTAIVGVSGSGKTTLIKLLLKFYSPRSGDINVAGQKLDQLNAKDWRAHCGVVMQDSYIFSDTIAGNIWVGSRIKDLHRLEQAARLANLHSFVKTLPFGYNTPVGKEGAGLSEGQKQRLLIARMIYKQPSFIFLDEATNSLDADNERIIIENLNEFFQGRTVIVVAHRLSTVRHADQIIVLDKGNIAEQGPHETLIMQKGVYYRLVKNQLELGK